MKMARVKETKKKGRTSIGFRVGHFEGVIECVAWDGACIAFHRREQETAVKKKKIWDASMFQSSLRYSFFFFFVFLSSPPETSMSRFFFSCVGRQKSCGEREWTSLLLPLTLLTT